MNVKTAKTSSAFLYYTYGNKISFFFFLFLLFFLFSVEICPSGNGIAS